MDTITTQVIDHVILENSPMFQISATGALSMTEDLQPLPIAERPLSTLSISCTAMGLRNLSPRTSSVPVLLLNSSSANMTASSDCSSWKNDSCHTP